jgi:3-isopropylmalate/(R)-2-methylmalate dehydratase small subunit
MGAAVLSAPTNSPSPSGAIHAVSGPALLQPGDDIDTDRIMPARFLKAVTFDGLETHLFEDDRREATGRGLTHPFDDPLRRTARVLVVGRNFGCGSSREHAPQAIRRWGIRAIVGESFAEIFFGNALMLGLPCVSIPRSDLAALGAAVSQNAGLNVSVDLDARTVSAGNLTAPATLPEAARHALTSGEWDATALLLADYDDVRRTAGRLPYLRGFSSTNN